MDVDEPATASPGGAAFPDDPATPGEAASSSDPGSSPHHLPFGAGVPLEPAAAPQTLTREERKALGRAEGAVIARQRAAARAAGARPAVDLMALGSLDRIPVRRDVSAAVAAGLAEGDPTLRFARPTAAAVDAAAAEALADPAFARASTVVLRPHWSESLAAFAGRATAAIERGARVVGVFDVTLASFGGPLERAVADHLGENVFVAVEDGRLDVVRAVAGRADIELDVVAPDAFASGLEGALAKIRRAAELDEAALSAAEQRARERGWFGDGVLEEPRADIRVRVPRGAGATYGVGRAEGAISALDDAGGPAEAAREAIRLAFGEPALGGYGSAGLARIHVGAHVLSEFTAALLEALEAHGDALGPEPWLRDAPGEPTVQLDDAVLAARRIGLDEGATLIFEARRKGARALVFTNVEPRMRLGADLRGPAILALLRARR